MLEKGIRLQLLMYTLMTFKLVLTILVGLILGQMLSFVDGFNELIEYLNVTNYTFGVVFMLVSVFLVKSGGNTNN
jgi:hypothetical protein